MELGYAWVSTVKQHLDRQVDVLQQAGIAPERICLDKKSVTTTGPAYRPHSPTPGTAT